MHLHFIFGGSGKAAKGIGGGGKAVHSGPSGSIGALVAEVPETGVAGSPCSCGCIRGNASHGKILRLGTVALNLLEERYVLLSRAIACEAILIITIVPFYLSHSSINIGYCQCAVGITYRPIVLLRSITCACTKIKVVATSSTSGSSSISQIIATLFNGVNSVVVISQFFYCYFIAVHISCGKDVIVDCSSNVSSIVARTILTRQYSCRCTTCYISDNILTTPVGLRSSHQLIVADSLCCLEFGANGHLTVGHGELVVGHRHIASVDIALACGVHIPVVQNVAALGSCRQGHNVASVGSCRTHFNRAVGLVSVIGDVVLRQLAEVRRIGGVACNGESAWVVSVVVVPLVKSVAVVGCGG